MSRILVLLVGLLSSSFIAQADMTTDPLSVAVAANFAAPLKALLPAFEQQTGIEVRVTVSSSGALYAQIEHGAPYDLFLSADSKRPQALVDAGLVDASQVQTYAIGRLALVGNVKRLDDPRLLLSSTRIAIADPDVAPYGKAAEQLFTQTGIWSQLAARLIRGSNIQQTLQFWQTGNVDVALIAASQCITYALTCHTVPNDYQPIVQQLAVLNGAASDSPAARLAAYIRSDSVQQQLTDMGYQPLTPPMLKD